jgi:hypothetical protein
MSNIVDTSGIAKQQPSYIKVFQAPIYHISLSKYSKTVHLDFPRNFRGYGYFGTMMMMCAKDITRDGHQKSVLIGE